MLEKLNNAENLLAITVMLLGLSFSVVAACLHDTTLASVGGGVVGAGVMAFKGTGPPNSGS